MRPLHTPKPTFVYSPVYSACVRLRAVCSTPRKPRSHARPPESNLPFVQSVRPLAAAPKGFPASSAICAGFARVRPRPLPQPPAVPSNLNIVSPHSPRVVAGPRTLTHTRTQHSRYCTPAHACTRALRRQLADRAFNLANGALLQHDCTQRDVYGCLRACVGYPG